MASNDVNLEFVIGLEGNCTKVKRREGLPDGCGYGTKMDCGYRGRYITVAGEKNEPNFGYYVCHKRTDLKFQKQKGGKDN